MVRPTGDRVREALFSILGRTVCGARVLDAYAGSGALGLEALSRGAVRATFVEADGGAVATLRACIASLGAESRCGVVQGRVLETLGRGPAAGPFDIVLADPPYGGGELGLFLERAASMLAGEGWLVVEQESGAVPGEAARLRLMRTAVYGRSSLDFYAAEGAGRGS